jgi:hypothetical protein
MIKILFDWIPVETILGMGKGEIKENGEWAEFNYDVSGTL